MILKSTPNLRARAAIARGEELAELGKYFDAVQQYQKALLRPETIAALTPLQRRVLAIDDAENVTYRKFSLM